MKVAIVGSRDYASLVLVRNYVQNLPFGTEVVSGGARGVDRAAESEGRARGLKLTIFPANWNRYGKQAGFIRNKQIVDMADCVVAFWDGVSKGTEHTIRYARFQHKPLTIYYADGQMSVENEEDEALL